MNKALILLTLLVSWPLAALAYDHYHDADDNADLPHVEIIDAVDFAALSSEAKRSGKIIMLEVSASDCGYCRTLEEEIIKPMLRSGDYEQQVLIRKLEIDRYSDVRHFSGARISPVQLAHQYDVFVTPTLMFLDGQGREVSERIVGINSLDFFGGYVDDALAEGHHKIQTNRSL